MEKKCYTEIYSRVCGFYRPIKQWNPGKQEEHIDKLKYDIKKEKVECSTTQN